MQTPSEPLRNADCGLRNEPDSPRRSVFSNFRSEISGRAETGQSVWTIQSAEGSGQSAIANPQSATDEAVARSFLYRFLAQAYEYPGETGWGWLCQSSVQGACRAAVEVFGDRTSLRTQAALLLPLLEHSQLESFTCDYIAVFGHAARGSCPLNEIEYGDLKADPLYQPHRLADLAAFYSAFGLEMTADAPERQDHLSIELEFMSVLAAKEAYALDQSLGAEPLNLCRAAQKQFLREHLGRWTPAFARRLVRTVGDGALGALAQFTQAFIELDCRRSGVSPGSDELCLRPVDTNAESLCGSCGLGTVFPGAIPAERDGQVE
jgi:DMSO reductase family type II enzyme chaperone